MKNQAAPNPLNLPRAVMRNNWKVEKVRQPQWLLSGMGGNLDQVALALIEYLKAEQNPRMRLAYAAEEELIPGSARTIRVISVMHKHHRAACDVHLYAQGPDLYIRFEIVARTWIGGLRWTLLGTAFALVFVGLYWALLCRTGMMPALATEYAQKYMINPMQRQQMIQTILHDQRWSLLDFAARDPKMFIERVAAIPTMIGGAIGFVLFRIPKDLLRYPCQWLGWPTPEKFRNEAISHSGRMQKTLARLLGEVFDRYEGTGFTKITE
jgi:hypothetical protein